MGFWCALVGFWLAPLPMGSLVPLGSDGFWWFRWGVLWGFGWVPLDSGGVPVWFRWDSGGLRRGSLGSVLIGSGGFGWVPVGFGGFRSGSAVVPLSSGRVPAVGSGGVPVGPGALRWGSGWVPLGSCGFRLGSGGFRWVRVRSGGFWWVPVGSGWLHWVPAGFGKVPVQPACARRPCSASSHPTARL